MPYLPDCMNIQRLPTCTWHTFFMKFPKTLDYQVKPLTAVKEAQKGGTLVTSFAKGCFCGIFSINLIAGCFSMLTI